MRKICSAVVGNQALTAYAFPEKGRPLEEVDFLMSLFERVLRETGDGARNVLRFVGI